MNVEELLRFCADVAMEAIEWNVALKIICYGGMSIKRTVLERGCAGVHFCGKLNKDGESGGKGVFKWMVC
jgi:hypothetical protein